MKNLVNKDTFTSLELLDLINQFRKEDHKSNLLHKNFLKNIREEFDLIGELNFEPAKIQEGFYNDKQGKKRLMYILTFNQARQVLVKESKFVRRKIIEHIEKLENHIKNFGTNPNYIPQNYSEALYLAAKQQEKIEEQTLLLESKDKEIAEMKSKSDYLDTILNSDSAMNVTQISNAFGMTSQTLNKILKENGVQYKCNRQWVLTSKYVNLGYTFQKIITFVRADGRSDTTIHTMWTQKGRKFIYDLLVEKGVI